jgi:hypothetical protein
MPGHMSATPYARDCRRKGQCVSWSLHIWDCACQGLYISGTVHVRDRAYQGLFVSGTVHVRDCACQGLFMSGSVNGRDCTWQELSMWGNVHVGTVHVSDCAVGMLGPIRAFSAGGVRVRAGRSLPSMLRDRLFNIYQTYSTTWQWGPDLPEVGGGGGGLDSVSTERKCNSLFEDLSFHRQIDPLTHYDRTVK